MPSKALAMIGLVIAGVVFGAAQLDGQATTRTSNQRLRFNNQPVVVPGEGTFTVNGGVHAAPQHA